MALQTMFLGGGLAELVRWHKTKPLAISVIRRQPFVAGERLVLYLAHIFSERCHVHTNWVLMPEIEPDIITLKVKIDLTCAGDSY